MQQQTHTRIGRNVLWGGALAAMALAGPWAGPARGEAEAFEVSAVAIGVARPPADAQERFGPQLNLERGTRVSVMLTSPGPGIVELDQDASRIDRFVDAAGTDLLEADDEAPARQEEGWFSPAFSPIGAFPRVSTDGSAIIVELRGQSIPAADAPTVELEALLALRVADRVETHRVESVSLSGQTLDVAGESIRVGEGDGFWGEGTSVKLTMAAAASERIAAVRFLDPAGEELSAQAVGSMTMMDEAEREFTLEQEAEQATLEIDMYTDVRTVQVPVRLELGLGLSARQ